MIKIFNFEFSSFVSFSVEFSFSQPKKKKSRCNMILLFNSERKKNKRRRYAFNEQTKMYLAFAKIIPMPEIYCVSCRWPVVRVYVVPSSSIRFANAACVCNFLFFVCSLHFHGHIFLCFVSL